MANEVATENSNDMSASTDPKKRFRCADVGYKDCAWQFEGDSTEAMLPTIRKHAADVHHLELKAEAIQHVQNSIHDAT